MWWPHTSNIGDTSSLVTEENAYCRQLKAYVDLNDTLTTVPFGVDRTMIPLFKHESNPFGFTSIGPENGRYITRCTMLYVKIAKPSSPLIGFNQIWAWYDGQYTYIGLNLHDSAILNDKMNYVAFDSTIPL